jgi:type I restriction enzyme S subunit
MKNAKAPPGWKRVKLKNCFDRVNRKNTEGNNNVLTLSAKYGLISFKDYFNKNVASEDLNNYYLLYKGDFAYNKSYSNGFPYGAIKRLNNYEKGVLSPLYICLCPKENTKCVKFFEYFFDAGMLNHEIKPAKKSQVKIEKSFM